MASRACDQHDSLNERTQCANDDCMFFACVPFAPAMCLCSLVVGLCHREDALMQE
jgi:hypothetical protein